MALSVYIRTKERYTINSLIFFFKNLEIKIKLHPE